MTMHRLKGGKVDIWAWASPDEIESAALTQLKNIASLPWAFHHVAVMPDVHHGKGATVGSVIAMKGAVSPAAVGVDIGCFTGDTQIPLADGKSYPIAELAQTDVEHVVYACSPTGRVMFATAKAQLTRRSAELVCVLLDSGEQIRCTPDHEFMLRDGSFCRADKLSAEASLMPLYQKLDRDGYMLVQQNYSGRWQKAHWIAARSGALGEIPRFEGQRTVIHHKNFDAKDNSPSNLVFMGANDHSKFHREIVERNEHWQSPEFEARRKSALRQKSLTPEGHAYFAQRGSKNIRRYMSERPDHFRAAIAGNGERGRKYLAGYNTSERGKAKSRELANRVHVCETCGEKVRSYIGLHNHRRYKHGYNHSVVSVEVLTVREDVYCLTVPKFGNFAISAGVFVHNCGMAAVQTSLTAGDLPDNLHALRSRIEQRIPVGFSQHESSVNRAVDKPLWSEFESLTPAVQDLFGKARKQLGTLGGGNHFIELCLDTAQRVWMMLHSGSRNIGKTLADVHISRAKKLVHNRALPDRDLAVFLAGTVEMDEYRRDLFWAQRYARTNREVMLDLFRKTIVEFFPSATFGEPIHCHHNYVSEEHHFDEDVLVTRKGAIRAGVGELGIIPGSMGTKSYIVKGLGNAGSFESASHGAGRRMSRTAAKKRFSIDDLIAQTSGVECRKDNGVVDEIPGAYKDIDQVMENQRDLVEIVAEIKQILCVKG